MTKSELIEQLSISNEQLNKRESELIVNTIFDSIGIELMQGGRVEIRGFGSFTIRSRDAREARNPKSGDVVMIPEKKTPFFKPGKELRERVNNGKIA
jgi:integration host factor subunit beta